MHQYTNFTEKKIQGDTHTKKKKKVTNGPHETFIGILMWLYIYIYISTVPCSFIFRGALKYPEKILQKE